MTRWLLTILVLVLFIACTQGASNDNSADFNRPDLCDCYETEFDTEPDASVGGDDTDSDGSISKFECAQACQNLGYPWSCYKSWDDCMSLNKDQR